MPASAFDALFAAPAVGRELARATVRTLHQDGSVTVAGADEAPVRCDALLTPAGTPARLVPGQAVLVWHPAHTGQRGVVLGAIGGAAPAPEPPAPGEPAHPPLAATLPAPRTDGDPDAVPESLVIEARRDLTLRVGEGSITLRADGRILIQGRDLVSSARRLNRIKGGAVSIN